MGRAPRITSLDNPPLPNPDVPPAPLDLQSDSDRADVVHRLRQGEVVALPTDTVPGLAVRADLPDAAAKLAALKGSPPDRPFSIHLGDLEMLQDWAPSLPPGLAAWLQHYLPQGVTAVLPSEWLSLPQALQWSWPMAGFRLPSDAGFRAVAQELQAPLLMTSINSSGEAPLRGAALDAWLQERAVPAAFEAGEAESEASQVVVFDPTPQVVRGNEMPLPALPGIRVLVLCSGNICRSPVAEALLRKAVAEAWHATEEELEALGWKFASAGTFAMSGGPISEHSYTVGQDLGLDLASHQSRHIEELLDQPWDLVLGMSPTHLESLSGDVGIELFDPRELPVPDPFGGDLEDYQAMADHLKKAVVARIAAWSSWPSP